MDTVYEPFGRDSGESEVRRATTSYAKLYAPAKVVPSVAGLLDRQFCDAWTAEFGISIDGHRAFLDRLHEFGLDPPRLTVNLGRSVVPSDAGGGGKCQRGRGLGHIEYANARATAGVASRGF